MNINIGDLFRNRAQITPNKEAFIIKEKRYTFAEMNDQINKFANYLTSIGLQPGDRMALICKNNDYFITAFFAASKLGIITVPVNWRLAPKELAYILEHSGSSLIIYDSIFKDAVLSIKEQLPTELLLEVGDSAENSPFLDVLKERKNIEPQTTTSNDDVTLMMYTSGTTGKPKGAMLSHMNLFGASVGISHVVDWWHQDRFLSVAPFFHIGGFAPLITNIHNGCTTILMEDFEPVSVWKTIEKEKVTTMMSVPAMLAVMLKVVQQVEVDYSSLRNFTCGASPVPKQLIDAYSQIGIDVQQVYGITEYTGAVSFWKKEMNPLKGDSMGVPVFHGDVKIEDLISGEELPNSHDGEILCRGPQVFKGYWNNPEESSKVLADGWYRSGDVGRIDEDGFLYVIDRLKDVIVSGGENIYSAEVEAVLQEHPEIAEVAVIGVPDQTWGEIPRAYVVRTPSSKLTENDIFTYCKEHLASYKAIKDVQFIEHLPRNAVGKILKQSLKLAEQA